MFEVAVIVLLATSSAVMIVRRWQFQRYTQLPATSRNPVSTISQAGLFRLTAPGSDAPLQAFANLHLVRGGLALRPVNASQDRLIDFGHIQWVSAVNVLSDGIAEMFIHLEAAGHWRVLHLRLPEADMAMLAKVLLRVIPQGRTNIGHTPVNPVGPVPARSAGETLQGETTLGAEVGLYLLPHMLVVLRGDSVQAKLDTSTIRRVLAVERISGKLDGLLNRGTPDGIVRLYSLHETASFALSQYREFADEISYLARCPVEHIQQAHKTEK
jgi:hypothetical protein